MAFNGFGRMHASFFLLALALCASTFAQVSTQYQSCPGALAHRECQLRLDDKHQLEPGDHVSFQILEDRDPPKSLIVADSKELDVPYIGRVAVKDKTCMQLAKELKALLEKEYYFRATVIVGLDSVNKVRGKVYIWGQVRTQGQIDILFNEELTAGKAICARGVLPIFANKKKVRLIRGSSGPDKTKQTFEINMVEVLEDGKAEKDLVLEPEDFIIVPSRAVNF